MKTWRLLICTAVLFVNNVFHSGCFTCSKPQSEPCLHPEKQLEETSKELPLQQSIQHSQWGVEAPPGDLTESCAAAIDFSSTETSNTLDCETYPSRCFDETLVGIGTDANSFYAGNEPSERSNVNCKEIPVGESPKEDKPKMAFGRTKSMMSKISPNNNLETFSTHPHDLSLDFSSFDYTSAAKHSRSDFFQKYQTLVNVLSSPDQKIEDFAKGFYKNHTLRERFLLYLAISQNFDLTSLCTSRCDKLMDRDKSNPCINLEAMTSILKSCYLTFKKLEDAKNYEGMLNLSWNLGFYSYICRTVKGFLNRDEISTDTLIELLQLVLSYGNLWTFSNEILWDTLLKLILKAYAVDVNGTRVSAFAVEACHKTISLIALTNLRSSREAGIVLHSSSPLICNLEAFMNVMDYDSKIAVILEIILLMPALCSGKPNDVPEPLISLYKVCNQEGERNFLHPLLQWFYSRTKKFWLIKDPLIRLGFSLIIYCLDITNHNVVRALGNPKCIEQILSFIEQASGLLPFSQLPFQNLLPPINMDASSPNMARVLNLASEQCTVDSPVGLKHKFLLEIYLENPFIDISVAHHIIKYTPRSALETIQNSMLDKLDPLIWATVFITKESADMIALQGGVGLFCEQLSFEQESKVQLHSAIRLLFFHSRRSLAYTHDDKDFYLEAFDVANMDRFFESLSIPESQVDLLASALNSLFLHYLTDSADSEFSLIKICSAFRNPVASELYCIRLAIAIHRGDVDVLIHLFYKMVLLHFENDKEFLCRGLVGPEERMALAYSWRMCYSLKRELIANPIRESILNLISLSDTHMPIEVETSGTSIVSSLKSNRIISSMASLNTPLRHDNDFKHFIVPVRNASSLQDMEHIAFDETVVPVYSEAEIETLVFLHSSEGVLPTISRPVEFLQTPMQTLVKLNMAPGIPLSTLSLPTNPDKAVDFMLSITNQALEFNRCLQSSKFALSEFHADTFYFDMTSDVLTMNSARYIRRAEFQTPLVGELQLLRFLLSTLYQVKRQRGLAWYSHTGDRLDNITETIGEKLILFRTSTANVGRPSGSRNMTSGPCPHITNAFLPSTDQSSESPTTIALIPNNVTKIAETTLDSGLPRSLVHLEWTTNLQPLNPQAILESDSMPDAVPIQQTQASQKAKHLNATIDSDMIILPSASKQIQNETEDDSDTQTQAPLNAKHLNATIDSGTSLPPFASKQIQDETEDDNDVQTQASWKVKNLNATIDSDTSIPPSVSKKIQDETADDHQFNAIFMTVAMVSVIATIVLVLSIYKFQHQNDSLDLLHQR